MFTELSSLFVKSGKEVSQSLKKLTDALNASPKAPEHKVFTVNTVVQFTTHYQNFFESQGELMATCGKTIETMLIDEPRKVITEKCEEAQKVLQKMAEVHEELYKTVGR